MGKETTYGVWAVRSGASIFGHAEAWCKEDGKPLEFDTREAAEAYARKMNNKTTANVHYYAQEKEPEPGAVRKTSAQAQPDLDARAHEEVTPRNDGAEKQNEIPGRQIMPEADPLVEIRSAVHSNYAGMVAMLGADNRVYLGREERCHYQDMQASYYDNQDGSLCFVCDQPDMYYFLYGRIPRRKCWSAALPCASMRNLQGFGTACSHSLHRAGKSCSPGSPSSRRRAICVMRNSTRKDRPEITICWMAGSTTNHLCALT